jgi:hypothetical protein
MDDILPEIEGNVPVDGPGGVQNNVGLGELSIYLRLRGMYQWTVPVESRIILGELSIYLRLRGMYQWTVPVESRIMLGELSIILITRNGSTNCTKPFQKFLCC